MQVFITLAPPHILCYCFCFLKASKNALSTLHICPFDVGDFCLVQFPSLRYGVVIVLLFLCCSPEGRSTVILILVLDFVRLLSIDGFPAVAASDRGLDVPMMALVSLGRGGAARRGTAEGTIEFYCLSSGA